MKTKWTYRQHIEAGKQLSRSRDELGTMLVSLGHSYPFSNKAFRLANRAQHVLDDLRSELDDQLARDYGDLFSAWVYYPHGNSPEYEEKMTALVERLAKQSEDELLPQ